MFKHFKMHLHVNELKHAQNAVVFQIGKQHGTVMLTVLTELVGLSRAFCLFQEFIKTLVNYRPFKVQ